MTGVEAGFGGKNLSRFAVAALLIPALHTAAGLLADLFDKEWGAAGRTSFGDGTVPQRKFARRVITAGEERTAFARPFLDEVTAASRLRTFHSERQWLRRLAFRIGGTGNELSETPGLDHHRAAAFLADLIGGELLLGNDLDRTVG
jgi:hypothetical protein